MPFVKSNWACEPALKEGGHFEFAQSFTVRDLTLSRGEQTRPCFLHVSSEVECVVRALSVVASVEMLDIYALVGPMDAFDYRHVAKVQGTPLQLEGPEPAYAFTIDAGKIPRERVWQLQLKLSSSLQATAEVRIRELSVQVEKAGLGAAAASSSSSGVKAATSTGLGASFSATTSSLAEMDLSRTGGTSANALSATGRTGLFQTGRSQLSSTTTSTAMRNTAAGGGRAGLNTTLGASEFDGAATTSSLGLSRSRPAAAAATATDGAAKTGGATARLDSTATIKQAAAAGTSALAGTGRSSLLGGASSDLTVRGGRSGSSAAAESSSSSSLVAKKENEGALAMRAETAAVASVLNAVCEKMVGVVSEKTKSYLAKAGKRTERRVLDKMAKLEERIERFDLVLENATVSSREIEQAILALDRDLAATGAASSRQPAVAVAP